MRFGCDADRRVATPRFTSCPIAVLCFLQRHKATVLPARLGTLP
jgi:hypothetical protein